MSRYRGVLFDVDGTMYRQGPLRLAMAAEMALAARSADGRRAARVIRAYRQAHEELRHARPSGEPVADVQLARAATLTALPVGVVQATVAEWMVDRPLKHLPWCRRRGLSWVLGRLEGAGVRLGVLSDYEPAAKLAALDVDARFSLRLCTSSGDINALKPHPRGFRVACEIWGLTPSEVLYVGDRPDVDGCGAMAAGLDCVIIGGRGGGRWRRITSFRHLDRLVFDS